MSKNTFGYYIWQGRRAKGLSQRELAEKLKIDFTYLSKLEADRLTPYDWHPDRPKDITAEELMERIALQLDLDLEEMNKKIKTKFFIALYQTEPTE